MSKKKIIILGSIVSVLVLAIALFLIFVVFKHEHTWTERTCTEGVYCTECNKIKQKYGYGHDYGEWIEIIESTCTSNGTKERSCKRCGEKESVTVRARGYHDYGNWTTVQEASCTVDGRKERTCTCGEKDTMTIKASHQYEKGICTKCGKGVIDITLPNTPLTVHYTYLGRINASVKIISIR